MTSKTPLILYVVFSTVLTRCLADDCQPPINDWGISGTNKAAPYHFEFLSLIQTNSRSSKKTISHYIRNVAGSAALPVEWVKGHMPTQVIPEGDCSFNSIDTFSATTIDPDAPIKYDIGYSKANDTEVFTKQKVSSVAQVRSSDPLESKFYSHIGENKEAIRLSFACGLNEGKCFYELRNLGTKNIQLTIPELTGTWRELFPAIKIEGWAEEKTEDDAVVQALTVRSGDKWFFTSAAAVSAVREAVVLVYLRSPESRRATPAGYFSVYLPVKPR
jgi:hypothetical protein